MKLQEANTFEEVMALEWEIDEYGYHLLTIRVNKFEAHFFMEPRPVYCDRGHWMVMCEYWRDADGINTLDRSDFFPRIYMSLDVAKDEIQRFIAWRALKVSEGHDELCEHHGKVNYL